MKTISYDDWLRRSDRMSERAQFILRYFDRAKLKRKKRDARVRPSKRNPMPPDR